MIEKGTPRARAAAFLITAVVLICAGYVVGSRLANLQATNQANGEYLLPSPQVLSLLSMGEQRSLGDLLMVKLVLYVGEKGLRHLPVEYAMGMLKNVTLLDPGDMEPYSFAFYLLSFNKRAIPEIVDFLKRGMRTHPQEWRLPLWLSILYKWELKKTEKARRWATVAAQYPNAPPHVKRLPTYMLYKEGRYQTALDILVSLYESSKSEKEKRILSKKIELMKELILLNQLVSRYLSIYRHYPASLEDLVKAGLIDHIPSPPYPHRRYKLSRKSHRVLLEGW